jgi:hypothetical protein
VGNDVLQVSLTEKHHLLDEHLQCFWEVHDSNIGLKTVYPDWGFWCVLLIPPSEFQAIISKSATADSPFIVILLVLVI